MTKVKTVLKFMRSTKGTHVFAYDSDDSEASIKTLYVQKEAMPANPPEMITVTVEAGDHLSD